MTEYIRPQFIVVLKQSKINPESDPVEIKFDYENEAEAFLERLKEEGLEGIIEPRERES